VATKDKFVIWIVSETLTDGSEAFNVEMDGATYACPTENDAVMLAEGIKELMERHALVETIDIKYVV
jgi:hypothetical protein